MSTEIKEINAMKQSEVSSNAMMVYSPPKRFVFISDLHFDRYHKLPSREEYRQLMDKMLSGEINPSEQRESEYQEDTHFLEREDFFIHCVKHNFSNDILILVGDFYTNFEKTLSFIKRLEAEKIESYFVLGNHDFSSTNQTGYYDIIKLFDKATSSHEYCKFLMTGKKYYHEDICIIGDTGWNLTNKIGPDSIMHTPPWIFSRESEKWIKFAKKVLKCEKKVLIATHFPQFDFPQSIDLKYIDWANAKPWFEASHCWQIFGHTHQRRLFQFYNSTCMQQGYRSKQTHSDNYREYSQFDFGILEKRLIKESDHMFDVTSAFNSLLPFYSAKLIQNPEIEIEAVKEVTVRGFKRTGHADNKRAIAALISNKQAYLASVRKILDSVDAEHIEYIGYVLKTGISLRVINAIEDSIDILEQGDARHVKLFMTALVITGYVYNGYIHSIEGMRPVDDYDIMRWYLLFATIQKYNLDPNEIKTVRKNQKECFNFQNIPIYLPKINNKSLKVEEVRALMAKTSLSEDQLLLND